MRKSAIGGIMIGALRCEPIASPGPCSICKEPADGFTFIGVVGRKWQLCGSEDCWTNAENEADELKAEAK